MKSIVTLKRLVTLVAKAAGVDSQMSTGFIDEFTRAVASGLERDGRVDISGFGTFSRDGLSGNEITFVPSDDIAAAINAPFDMFEAEELADEYIEEERTTEPVQPVAPAASADDHADDMDAVQDTIQVTPPAPAPEPQSAPETPAVPALKPEQKSEPEPVREPVRPPYPAYNEPESQPQPVSAPMPQPKPQPETEPVQDAVRPPYHAYSEPEPQPIYEPELQPESAPEPVVNTERYTEDNYGRDYERRSSGRKHRKRDGFGSYVLMMIGFVMLSFFIGAVAGYFTYPMLNRALSSDDADVQTVESAEAETLETPITTPEQSEETTSLNDEPETPVTEDTSAQPVVVTDTVKAGNSLARIARTHYGRSEFWVYIYIANESKLGNPDMIASGTILVIPPAEQYGIDGNDPESIRRAKAKASEIYNKYK